MRYEQKYKLHFLLCLLHFSSLHSGGAGLESNFLLTFWCSRCTLPWPRDPQLLLIGWRMLLPSSPLKNYISLTLFNNSLTKSMRSFIICRNRHHPATHLLLFSPSPPSMAACPFTPTMLDHNTHQPTPFRHLPLPLSLHLLPLRRHSSHTHPC